MKLFNSFLLICQAFAFSGVSKMTRTRTMSSSLRFSDNAGPLLVPNVALKMTTSTAVEADDDAEKKIQNKVEGRKKRVVLGYKTTALAYLVFAGRALYLNGGFLKSRALYIASGHFSAAALGYILNDAAANDRLKSDTYKRLNLALFEYSALGLTLVTLSERLRTPMFIIPPLVGAINSVKGYSYGVLGWDKKKPPTNLVTDLADGTKKTLKNILNVPGNIKSSGYLAATLMVATMKLRKLYEIASGAGIIDTATLIGLARFGRLALLTSILYTLKDAADRNRLEGSTFIKLNFLSSIALGSMAAYMMKEGFMKLGAASTFFAGFSAVCGTMSIFKKEVI